jgi:peptidoglycan/LPS O-acetylase OafA/YrhL
MSPSRLRLFGELLVLIAAPLAVAAAAMANYSGQPTGTQIAWIIIAALFTFGGGLAQIVVASLQSGADPIPSEIGAKAGLFITEPLKKERKTSDIQVVFASEPNVW